MTVEQVKEVRIGRPNHTVRLVGDSIDRADLHIETGLPGTPETDRSSRDSLLGEKGYINLSWSAMMNRSNPRKDDPFPVDMPDAISNMTIYGREDHTEGMSPELPLEYMHIDHLHVQEEARGMGYGQLMWDCYVALVAHIDGDASGKVGDDEDRGTAAFLLSQGVPDEDIEESDSSAWLGENRAAWRTDGRNIIDPAPVEITTTGAEQ